MRRRLTGFGMGAVLMMGLIVAGCGGDTESAADIPFERYQLANGLTVVLHVDRSDPIAAVAMTFHVGSAREVPGRTGFAHLFEHLFFLDSENLGPGGLDRLMTRIGSSTNGSTSRDSTNYFEVVPTDGLEKTLWAEADKLGYFINTVTDSVVTKEKQVVKNEKRQSVDNQPYGHVSDVIDRALYPQGHPYRWQVIGSLEDLDNATLADVVEFHQRWYGPENATLVVAGDIDVAKTKAWIQRYFEEIPRSEKPTTPEPPAVRLTESVRLHHEDNFARVPQLTVAWPSVPRFHPDAYALDALAALLTQGKSTPFYEVLVTEDKVAPGVSAGNQPGELAGRFTLQVRAFDGTNLNAVQASITKAFARFETQGVRADELERVKAGYETQFYGGLGSVLGKAFQLADYSIFAGDPGFGPEDLERQLGVTAADVMRVYEKYIKGQPSVAASFVPRGQSALALASSQLASVVEEPIVMGAEAELAEVQRGETRTPSAFDRSVEPPFGTSPSLSAPTVWRTSLDNGLQVLGIDDREVPLVQFELRLKGGQLLDDPALPGVANLLAETMTQGTAKRTPEELEKAIDLLGATINVSASGQYFVVSGRALARNYAATIALAEEILLEPRFDPEQFELARQRVRNALRQRTANPTAIAADAFNRLLYGDHILAGTPLGTLASIDRITIDALKAYHARALTPAMAAFHVVGAVTQAEATQPLAGLASRWKGDTVPLPAAPVRNPAAKGLYFVDVPNSSQSVVRIGYLALAETDEAYYPASVMNFRLGGGGFASELTLILREQRGYTYGINSGFSGTNLPGPFQIGSSVRSNVTLEALQTIKSIVEAHGPGFDAADLETTQGFLLRANARAFEAAGAKIGLLSNMSQYGFPADYVLQRERIVRDMTVDRVRELSNTYLKTGEMVWLVVGDARTQAARLSALGLGAPVMLSLDGQPVR